jgi:hypothetical protein
MATTYAEWKTKVWIVNEVRLTKGVVKGDRLVFSGVGDGTDPKNILGRIPQWAKNCEHEVVTANVEDRVYVKDSTQEYTITRDANGLICKTGGKGSSSGQVVWTAVEGG